MTIYVYKLKYAILVDRRINRTTTTTTKTKYRTSFEAKDNGKI
jgi:hypothetical protein